jgi:hypothetical protein
MAGVLPEAYAAFTNPILASFAEVTTVTKESDVAEAVWRAANDASDSSDFQPVPMRWRWPSRSERDVGAARSSAA